MDVCKLLELQEVLVFWLDSKTFALKTTDIQEIIPYQPVNPVPRAPSYIAGIINLRGSLLTILDTSARIFQDDKSINRTQEHILVTLVESWPVGLLVGTIEGIVNSEITDVKEAPQSSQLPENIKGDFIESLIKWTVDNTEKTSVLLNLGALVKPFSTPT